MSQNSRSCKSLTAETPWAAITVVLLFSIAFYRTAWVAEDAFITFRVIDNTLNGLGLVWNPGERVQAFTHPLWFGLLVVIIDIIGDPYFSALLLAYVLLLTTLIIFWQTLRTNTWLSLAPLLALLWSQSFIDYSSSGLENPLTHALIALFTWAWLNNRQTLLLTVITAGLFLTRPDTIVLIAPAMTFHLWQTRQWKMAIFGALPAIVWVAFSLFYYGAPVPNTALAKVGTGLSIADRSLQAINYFAWTYTNDPVTLVILVFGIICGYLNKNTRLLTMGLLLFAIYLFYVGADYMGGRFFSAPVLLAALLIASYRDKKIFGFLAIILISSAWHLNASLLAPTNYENKTFSNDIADERGHYYQSLGLASVIRAGSWRRHPWYVESALPPGLYTRCTIGMAGYAGGPNIHWIDPLALTEPFLARLPSRNGSRVGHYERALPEGYLESLVTGQNRIADPGLNALYSDLKLAIHAPLLDPERAGAIWRLNTGFHRHAAANFNREAIGLPGRTVQSRSIFACHGILYDVEHVWAISGNPPMASKPEAKKN